MVEVRILIDPKTIKQMDVPTKNVLDAIKLVQEKYPKGQILSAIYFKK